MKYLSTIAAVFVGMVSANVAILYPNLQNLKEAQILERNILDHDFQFGGQTGASYTNGDFSANAGVESWIKGNANANISLEKIEAELSASLNAKLKAEGRYGESISAEAFAEATADVLARIIANQAGIFADASAGAKIEAGVNANVGYGSRGGEWNSEILASLVAQATAKMEFTGDGGLKTELGGSLGPLIKGSTGIGAGNNQIEIGF